MRIIFYLSIGKGGSTSPTMSAGAINDLSWLLPRREQVPEPCMGILWEAQWLRVGNNLCSTQIPATAQPIKDFISFLHLLPEWLWRFCLCLFIFLLLLFVLHVESWTNSMLHCPICAQTLIKSPVWGHRGHSWHKWDPNPASSALNQCWESSCWTLLHALGRKTLVLVSFASCFKNTLQMVAFKQIKASG